MTFPFKTFLTDNLKIYVWTYLFIIADLNVTKNFHIISSKNPYGEFYARTAPGFWAPPMLILSKMSLLIFQKMYCQQCPSLLQRMLFLIPWKNPSLYKRLLSLIRGDYSNLKLIQIQTLKSVMALQDQPFKNCKKWMLVYKDRFR